MLMETMDMICVTFEHVGSLPPLGIVQHAVNPNLLEVYCTALANWLEKYLQDAPEAIFLSPDYVIEYLQQLE